MPIKWTFILHMEFNSRNGKYFYKLPCKKESYYNCTNSIANIQEKLEKYNEYTEEYNEIMSHFPYSWIEYFSLKKIRF